MIPYLYYEQFYLKENSVTTKAIHYKQKFLSNLNDNISATNLNRKKLIDNMPFPFNKIDQKNCDKIEFSLSNIVTKLFNFLITATSNSFIVSMAFFFVD